MAKLRFKTQTVFEYDTDTGKSKLIQHFSTPLGVGSTQRTVTKELKTENTDEVLEI